MDNEAQTSGGVSEQAGEKPGEAPAVEASVDVTPEPAPLPEAADEMNHRLTKLVDVTPEPVPLPEPPKGVKCALDGREYDVDDISPIGINYRYVHERVDFVKAALASGRYHVTSDSEFRQMMLDADKVLAAAYKSKFQG